MPLPPPRPDGTGWPALDARPTFAANALHESGLRNAFEIEAHAVADRLVDQLLPRLPTAASPEDEPYVRKTVLTAARVGAGLGMTARGGEEGPDEVGHDLAGALLLARQALPAMPPPQAAVVGYFLLAGFRVARLGPDEVDRLDGAL